MLWINVLGFSASASVLATFCMRAMLPLRVIAICSNVLFAAYGALLQIYPVLALHVILLPINVVRLIQVVVSVDDPATVAAAPITLASLLSVMRWQQIRTSIAEWQRRARERHELTGLCERDRRDIRICHCEVQAEALKPFWRG